MPSIIWKFDKAEITNFLHGLIPFILTNGSLPNNKNHILCERKKETFKKYARDIIDSYWNFESSNNSGIDQNSIMTSSLFKEKNIFFII